MMERTSAWNGFLPRTKSGNPYFLMSGAKRLSHFRIFSDSFKSFFINKSGCGGGEIRTHDALRHTGFRNRRTRPTMRRLLSEKNNRRPFAGAWDLKSPQPRSIAGYPSRALKIQHILSFG